MEFHPIAYPVVCSTNAVQFGFSCRHVEPMHVSLVVVDVQHMDVTVGVLCEDQKGAANQ